MSMSRSFKRIMLSAGTVLATVVTGGLITSSPAVADSFYNCAYPRVCFYLTTADWNAKRVTASYRDMTSGYQTLGSSSRGAAGVANTRNDDGAKLLFDSGKTLCVDAGTAVSLRVFADLGRVTGVRIMDSADC